MNLPLFVARKYFLSGKKINFIHIISMISMIGVAFGTMSLVIALSVFNGFEGLIRSVYGNFDPDIIIRPKEGKSFIVTESMRDLLHQTQGISAVVEVIEDHVLVAYKEAQQLVRMKGVSEEFVNKSGFKEAIIEGDFLLSKGGNPHALVGRGVQYNLSLNMHNEFYTLQVYYPKNIAPGVIHPDKLYTSKSILPGGVFVIEKFYDENYILVPIAFAEELLNYEGRRTTIELETDKNASHSAIIKSLDRSLGSSFEIFSGDELHSDLYKILNIEKLFTFLVFIIIISIASINLFFSLTMLVIEKQKDISILVAQGAPPPLIKRIFLYEGCLVSFIGVFFGLILGISISYLQQKYGFIGLGVGTAVIQSYPIKIEWTDIMATVLVVIVITILVSIQPAYKASTTFSTNSL